MAVQQFNNTNFDAEVRQSTGPVLVDFFATWCGPCQMVGPIVEQIAAENPGLKVGKVNTDENTQVAIGMGITSIPALIVFRDGKELGRSIGFQPKAQLEAWLRGLGVI